MSPLELLFTSAGLGLTIIGAVYKIVRNFHMDLMDRIDRRFGETQTNTDRIERKVDKINGTVDKHESAINLLKHEVFGA